MSRRKLFYASTLSLRFRSLSARLSGLVVLMLALILVGVSMVERDVASGMRVKAMDVLSPVLAVLTLPAQAISDFVGGASGITQLRSENERLRSENVRLKSWYQRALALESQNVQLQDVVNLVDDVEYGYITTRIISDSGRAFVQSVLIPAGQADGVEKGQAVIVPEGMIGRIVSAGQNAARILLITDLNSRIPVLVEGVNQRAVLAGDNSAQPSLVHLPDDVEVKEGMRVVTSGHGGVLPPGLPVGRVKMSENGAYKVALFTDVNRISYVQVVDYGIDPALSRGVLTISKAE